MAKLIERIGKETKVDGKPIDLSKLVNVGVEIIAASYRSYSSEQERVLLSKKKALKTSMEIAQRYGCSYVMLGNNPQLLGHSDAITSHYLFVATFYNEKA